MALDASESSELVKNGFVDAKNPTTMVVDAKNPNTIVGSLCMPMTIRDVERLTRGIVFLYVALHVLLVGLYYFNYIGLSDSSSGMQRVAYSFTSLAIFMGYLLNKSIFKNTNDDTARVGSTLLGVCNLLGGTRYLFSAVGFNFNFLNLSGQPIMLGRHMGPTMCEVLLIAYITRQSSYTGLKQCGLVFAALFGWFLFNLAGGGIGYVLKFLGLACICTFSLVTKEVYNQVHALWDLSLASPSNATTKARSDCLLKVCHKFFYFWVALLVVHICLRLQLISYATSEIVVCMLDFISKAVSTMFYLTFTDKFRSSDGVFVDKLLKSIRESLHLDKDTFDELLHKNDAVSLWLKNEFSISTHALDASDEQHIDYTNNNVADRQRRRSSYRIGVFAGDLTRYESILQSWEWDALHESDEECFCVLQYIFRKMDFFNHFQIKAETFENFVQAVRASYPDNPYHNWKHVVTVTHSLYMLIASSECHLMPLDRFSAFVAAICHDLSHPGLNNTFHINTHHELALKFNDQSVLENFHCLEAFRILGDPACNIASSLNPTEYLEFRSILVGCILGTDMLSHVSQIESIKLTFTTMGPMAGKALNLNDRKFALKTFVHAADLYNAFKPFEIARNWAILIHDEFRSQTELEEKLGLPWLPFMRISGDSSLAKGQVGFINAVVQPFWEELASLFPKLSHVVDRLRVNSQLWAVVALKNSTDNSSLSAALKKEQ